MLEKAACQIKRDIVRKVESIGRSLVEYKPYACASVRGLNISRPVTQGKVHLGISDIGIQLHILAAAVADNDSSDSQGPLKHECTSRSTHSAQCFNAFSACSGRQSDYGCHYADNQEYPFHFCFLY